MQETINSQTLTQQESPVVSQSSSQNRVPETPHKSPNKLLFMSVIVVFILIIIGSGGFIFLKSKQTAKSTNTSQETAVQTSTPTTQQVEESVANTNNDLERLFSGIERTYNGDVPWINVNNREAFQFYPNEIRDFPLSVKEISVIVDNDYNPITVMSISDSVSVPIKNAFVGYYEVPEVMNEKYKLDNLDVVFPIELKVYEFERKLIDSELSWIKSPYALNCYNDYAKIEKYTYSSERVIVHLCDLKATADQRSKSKDLFDFIYMIYFMDRNLVLQIKFNSQYVDSHNAYIGDYLIKLLSSNSSLFINSGQINSAGEIRDFEEWRRRTFDN